ncbi:MAG: carboxylating nicotinate-nucleotide diphosphorylase [Magnetospiraceae bacterium]
MTTNVNQTAGAPTPEEMAQAQSVIKAALDEDLGEGDITSEAVIPVEAQFAGTLSARHDMVVAGLPFIAFAFHQVDPTITVELLSKDSDYAAAGTVLARVEGSARNLLGAERTALNLLQHLSGIATLTRTYAVAMGETQCVLLDTRKTLPGMRRLAKYATRMGGARNHRMSLGDAVLIKDNHVAVCGSLAGAVHAARAADNAKVAVECDTLGQVDEAIGAGADWILLDNMTCDQQRDAVGRVDGRAEVEASGGVNLETIAAIAATGVDYVSVGRLTQSAPAVDIGMDWSML